MIPSKFPNYGSVIALSIHLKEMTWFYDSNHMEIAYKTIEVD